MVDDSSFASTALGYAAGVYDSSGYANCYFGSGAGFYNKRGYENIYVGYHAGLDNLSSRNVFIGTDAGQTGANSFGGTYLGTYAGRSATGNYNIFVGDSTGYNVTGGHNIVIGSNGPVTAPTPSASDQLNIGNAIYGTNIYSSNPHIGINNSAPNASAILDLSSTSTGLLIPRMNTSLMNAIVTPASGLLIYNTDSIAFCYYHGVWTRIADASNSGGWNSNGNSSINAGNFIGTTNNSSLRVRTDNVQRVIIDSLGNVGMDTNAPSAPLEVSGN